MKATLNEQFVNQLAAYDPRPALPSSPCRRHEPHPVESRLLQRLDIPCPDCFVSNPKNSRRLVQRHIVPEAEPGPHGVGLRVGIVKKQTVEWEACSFSGKDARLVWRRVI